MTQKQVVADLINRLVHAQQNEETPLQTLYWVAEFIGGMAVRNGIGDNIGFELGRFFKHKSGTLGGHDTRKDA